MFMGNENVNRIESNRKIRLCSAEISLVKQGRTRIGWVISLVGRGEENETPYVWNPCLQTVKSREACVLAL